jgi:hypothetical protein
VEGFTIEVFLAGGGGIYYRGVFGNDYNLFPISRLLGFFVSYTIKAFFFFFIFQQVTNQ